MLLRFFWYWRLRLLSVISILLLIASAQAAEVPMPRESQLQAVFLYRFTLFVDWPDSVFKHAESPLNFCIFGQHQFGNVLNLTVKDELYKTTRPMQILYLSQLELLTQCHLLFISASEAAQIKTILQQVSQLPILTVSNQTDFITMGGMIEFYSRNNRVRFMINPETVRKQNLRVNANLLRVGDVVQ
jgi:hypothetical protein